jgi:hypothetical protein
MNRNDPPTRRHLAARFIVEWIVPAICGVVIILFVFGVIHP